MRNILGAIAALLVGSACHAATTAGSFDVNIALTSRPGGLCLSESLSAATGASVHVVCKSNQFVSIDPHPGRPFLGVHGGAFRYVLDSATAPDLGISPFIGAGTVTGIRLYNIGGPDGPLEVLISF